MVERALLVPKGAGVSQILRNPNTLILEVLDSQG